MPPLITLTPAAAELIISAEVGGGQKVYERRYIHPEWPKGDSGVTIGIGYDLGMVKLAQFQADWSGYLTAAIMGRLSPCIGKTGGHASALLASVRDITVPWNAA